MGEKVDNWKECLIDRLVYIVNSTQRAGFLGKR